MEPEEYFRMVGNDGKGLRVPADLDEWISRYTALSAGNREKFDRGAHGPHGQGKGIGTAPLFPSPRNPSKPMDRHLADRWLRKAEKLAGLESQKGSLWHAFRRKAATELKHAADKDVQALLGWRDLRSMKQAYQHADPEGMLEAIESRRELREAR